MQEEWQIILEWRLRTALIVRRLVLMDNLTQFFIHIYGCDFAKGRPERSKSSVQVLPLWKANSIQTFVFRSWRPRGESPLKGFVSSRTWFLTPNIQLYNHLYNNGLAPKIKTAICNKRKYRPKWQIKTAKKSFGKHTYSISQRHFASVKFYYYMFPSHTITVKILSPIHTHYTFRHDRLILRRKIYSLITDSTKCKCFLQMNSQLDFTFIAAQHYGRFWRYFFLCLFIQVGTCAIPSLFSKINRPERWHACFPPPGSPPPSGFYLPLPLKPSTAACSLSLCWVPKRTGLVEATNSCSRPTLIVCDFREDPDCCHSYVTKHRLTLSTSCSAISSITSSEHSSPH